MKSKVRLLYVGLTLAAGFSLNVAAQASETEQAQTQPTTQPATEPATQPAGEPEHKELPISDKLEPYQCGSIERLHTFGGIFLASQPNAADLKTASESGIKTVINLRKKEEIDWDEEGFVKELGMTYYNLPFKSPFELSDELFDAARKILTDESQKPILIHCSTANRVGAIWLAHRVLDDRINYNDALEEAKTVGLRLPAYIEKTKNYIDRNRN